MNTITLHRSYCQEHAARDHMVDERGKCHGADTTELKTRGYFYLRHIGGGWFRYRTPSQPLPLEWQLAIERQETLTDILAMQNEPDF